MNEDADEGYNLLQSILLSTYNEHFPFHTKNTSNNGKSKPSVTSGML